MEVIRNFFSELNYWFNYVIFFSVIFLMFLVSFRGRYRKEETIKKEDEEVKKFVPFTSTGLGLNRSTLPKEEEWRPGGHPGPSSEEVNFSDDENVGFEFPFFSKE